MIKSIFIVLFLSSTAFCQSWNFIDKDYTDSIVAIQTIAPPIITVVNNVKEEKLQEAYVSGTIIFQDESKKCPEILFQDYVYTEILTCSHFRVPKQNKILVRTKDSIVANAKIKKIGKIPEFDFCEDELKGQESKCGVDACILSCYLPKMKPIPFVALDTKKFNETFTVVGLGNRVIEPVSKETIRVFTGNRIGNNAIFALDCNVIPGDSGGAIIYQDHVVGVISGGYRWFNGKVKYTWPTTSSLNSDILSLIKE